MQIFKTEYFRVPNNCLPSHRLLIFLKKIKNLVIFKNLLKNFGSMFNILIVFTVTTKTANQRKPPEATPNHLKRSATTHSKLSAATEPTLNQLEVTRTSPKQFISL